MGIADKVIIDVMYRKNRTASEIAERLKQEHTVIQTYISRNSTEKPHPRRKPTTPEPPSEHKVLPYPIKGSPVIDLPPTRRSKTVGAKPTPKPIIVKKNR